MPHGHLSHRTMSKQVPAAPPLMRCRTSPPRAHRCKQGKLRLANPRGRVAVATKVKQEPAGTFRGPCHLDWRLAFVQWNHIRTTCGWVCLEPKWRVSFWFHPRFRSAQQKTRPCVMIRRVLQSGSPMCSRGPLIRPCGTPKNKTLLPWIPFISHWLKTSFLWNPETKPAENGLIP